MKKIITIATAALLLLLALSTSSASADSPALGPGLYDNTAPVFDVSGSGAIFKSITHAYRGTAVELTDSTTSFSFRVWGDGFRVIYATYSSGATMQVMIDGIIYNISTYSPTTTWQTHTEFAGLGPGIHDITISSLDDTGGIVSFDAVLVLPHVEAPETTAEPVEVVVTVEPVIQAAPEWIDTYSAEDGHAVAFDYSVSAGEVMSSVLLFGLLVLGLFGFSRQQLRKL